MKTTPLLLLICIILFACTKAPIQPQQSSKLTNNTNSSASASGLQSGSSNFYFLTAHTWIYKQYYSNSINKKDIGDLVYKRGRQNNQLDLDYDQVSYNTDGTVTEINNGVLVPGNWGFTSADSSSIYVSNVFGFFPSKIILLNDSQYVWHNSRDLTTGVMIPQ